jgi:hypothetical protein
MDVTAEFELPLRFIFEDCDEESVKKGACPFTTNTRSLLTHGILNNLAYKKAKKEDTHITGAELQYMRDVKNKADSISQQGMTVFFLFLKIFEIILLNTFFSIVCHKPGLPFMLNEGYFEESFILHEPTKHSFHINSLLEFAMSALHDTNIDLNNENHDIFHLINDKIHPESECTRLHNYYLIQYLEKKTIHFHFLLLFF